MFEANSSVASIGIMEAASRVRRRSRRALCECIESFDVCEMAVCAANVAERRQTCQGQPVADQEILPKLEELIGDCRTAELQEGLLQLKQAVEQRQRASSGLGDVQLAAMAASVPMAPTARL